MKKFIIMIPVYNDWDSLKKLISEINENIEITKNVQVECLIVNDASTIKQPKLNRPKNIKSIKILNMRKNQGHARCNAFGIRYINKNIKFDNLILMDGDGEDRPVELKSLINKIIQYPDKSVIAKRIKRSEGNFFQFLYFFHKLITLIFTGKKINFGNYSCLNKNDVQIISTKASLWSSYSGTVKYYINNLNEINSIRGARYFGPSKMSLFKLIVHSFSIIAVFKYQVFVRSILMCFLLNFFSNGLKPIIILAQIILILFSITIFIVSKREKKEDLINSQENLKSINEVSQ